MRAIVVFLEMGLEDGDGALDVGGGGVDACYVADCRAHLCPLW